MNFGLDGARDFENGVQRNRIEPLFHPEQQSLDDGERKRQLQAEGSSLPEARFEADRGFQAMQNALDDIHANTTSGDFGDLFGGREAGAEDEVERFLLGELRRFVGGS